MIEDAIKDSGGEEEEAEVENNGDKCSQLMSMRWRVLSQ